MNDARWHSTLALILTLSLAACGSQSRANEGESGQGEEPAADAPAARAPAPDATQDDYPADDGADEAPTAREQTSRRSATTERTREQKPQKRSEAAAPSETREEAPAPQEAPTTSAREESREEAPATATVVAGTRVSATLDQKLSTDANQKGDTFTATVSEPVIEGSRVLIPQGAILRGTITAIQKAQGDKPPMLTLNFESIDVRGESSSLAATLVSADVRKEKKMKGEAKKIGGGAAAGGLVGGLLGGDVKDAVIGAAIGSAAGTAITLATQEGHAVLPDGTPMEIRVDEAFQVRI